MEKVEYWNLGIILEVKIILIQNNCAHYTIQTADSKNFLKTSHFSITQNPMKEPKQASLLQIHTFNAEITAVRVSSRHHT